MSDKFVMSARQAAELDHAFERNGFTPADVKLLSTGTILAGVRNVLVGYAEITFIPHVIDCDAYPFVPDGWRVEEHQKGGKFKWDPTKVELYRNRSQQKGKYTRGNLLHKELKGMPILNANVLDYLLANPHLIPEIWKEKTNGDKTYIFFWGTIYYCSPDGGRLHVRYLHWDGAQWHCGYDWVDRGWHDNSYAVLRAS